MSPQDNLATIEKYYAAMAKKDTKEMEKYVEPDIVCIGPLAKAVGKEQVLGGVARLGKYYNKLTVRAKSATGDQVFVIYDLDFPAPMERISTAALFTFKGDKINHLELIYDPRTLLSKKEELFPQAVHK